MGGFRKFKKGDKGENLRFITRNEAAKKLQVSLKVFRKLCIIKGIHPRNPRKKLKGKSKTYYYAKDIRFLQHEKLIDIIRARKAAKVKSKKLEDRKEFGALKSFKKSLPEFSLDHIVKERYPTFQDALKDLDDCLSLVHLFASLDSSAEIKDGHITRCETLAREFQYYVMKSQSLRKVFLSIKGVYYQAEIMGETITWIAPLNYVNKKEKNVDYGVMINFLEFYETLMRFVNYRLFSSIGLQYPPRYDQSKLGKGDSLASILERKPKATTTTTTTTTTTKKTTKEHQTKKSESQKKLESKLGKINEVETEEVEEEDEMNNLEINSKGVAKDFEGLVKDGEDDLSSIPKIFDSSKLFDGFVFYLNREVPKHMLEFIITSFGGKVSWEGGDYAENDDKITHQIVDRKSLEKLYPTREYIQPQWVFDSVNNRYLLPVQEYGPGLIPPPHLSPFVIYEDDSYIPQRKAALDALINQKDFDSMKEKDQEMPDQEDEDSGEDDEEMEEDDENIRRIEQRYLQEMQQENKKRKQPDVPQKDGDNEDDDQDNNQDSMDEDEPVVQKEPTKKEREQLRKQKKEEEETKLAESMIKKKDMWLYNKIKDTNKQRQESNQALMDKRNKLAEGKDVNGKPREGERQVPLPKLPKVQKPQPNNKNNNNNNNSKNNKPSKQPAKKFKSSK
ncbi:hypothetical protein DLAC_07430 [Tieghemostelium lacteum]|uniref:Pescadillo homolog n=1 Tax=Tieghemostelium lacteum TaxID=361077 RepID=A0A151ZCQ3_TIELA|nr:hypothetical protein DLAC_07430 [Tieghemostelium lacteum]|eukprot:KYQ91654.1 hypothetical protein DLAC_07430 [Tieghemostelium lacteum]